MPFNGSGGFVPLSAPIFPAVPNTTIVSSYYNQNLLDVMSGLGNTITRDGQSPATANLPMGGFKFSNVGPATGSGEVLVWGQTGTPTFTNLALSGTLSVGGLTTLSAGLNVTGATALTGTLGVSGLLTASGSLMATGAILSAVVSGVQLGTLSGFPAIGWQNLGAAVDQKRWDAFADGTTLHFRMVNDANSNASDWLAVVRSGFAPQTITFPSTATVGIGGVATRQLSVFGGAGTAFLQITNNTAGVAAANGLELAHDGTNAYILQRENGPLILDVNGTERFRAGTVSNVSSQRIESLGTTGEAFRAIDNSAYYSFYSSGSAARTGYLQITNTGVCSLVNEVVGAGTTVNLSVNGSSRVVIDGAGRVQLPFSHNNASGISGAAYLGSQNNNTLAVPVTSNITAIVQQGSTLFDRVGNIVTMSAAFTVTTTGAGGFSFEVTPPIATTFTSAGDAAGVGANNGGIGFVIANTGTNRILAACSAATPATPATYTFHCQYVVK